MNWMISLFALTAGLATPAFGGDGVAGSSEEIRPLAKGAALPSAIVRDVEGVTVDPDVRLAAGRAAQEK